jgi:hypothetical protein
MEARLLHSSKEMRKEMFLSIISFKTAHIRIRLKNELRKQPKSMHLRC